MFIAQCVLVAAHRGIVQGMETEDELEQFVSTRIIDVHLVNLAGNDHNDSSGSEDYDDEDYKPLLTSW